MLSSNEVYQVLSKTIYSTLALQSQAINDKSEFFDSYEQANDESLLIPLMIALTERLLEQKIPLVDQDAKRFINLASEKKDLEMLKLLAQSSELLCEENKTILITTLASKGMKELLSTTAFNSSFLPSKTLKHSVESSDISELARCIAHGNNLSLNDSSTNVLIHIASENLDLDMIKVILKNQLGNVLTPNSLNFSPVQSVMRSALKQLDGKNDQEKDAIMKKAKSCIEYLQKNGAGYLLVKDDKYFPSQNIGTALKNAFKDYINGTTITFAGYLLLGTTCLVMVQLLPLGIVLNTLIIGLTSLIGFALLINKSYHDAKNPVKDSVDNMLTNLSVDAFKIDLDRNIAIGSSLKDYDGNIVATKQIKEIVSLHPAFKNSGSGIYSTENLPMNEHGGLNMNFKRQQALLKSMVARFKELQKELENSHGNESKQEKLYSAMAEVAHSYDLVQIGLVIKELNLKLELAMKPENILALAYHLRTNKVDCKEFEALAERIRSGKIKVPLHTRICLDEVTRLINASAKDGASCKQNVNFDAKSAIESIVNGKYQEDLNLRQVLDFSDEFRTFAKDKITESRSIGVAINDFVNGAREVAGNFVRNAADFVGGAADMSRAEVIEKVAGAAGTVAGTANAVGVGYVQATSNPITQAIMFIGGLAACIAANKFLIVKALDHAKYSALSSMKGIACSKPAFVSLEDFAKEKLKAESEKEIQTSSAIAG